MLIDNKPDAGDEDFVAGTLLLHDIHGEYTGCLSDLPVYGPKVHERSWRDDYVRIQIIWDQYELESTVELLELVDPQPMTDADGNPRVTDSDARVTAAFKSLFGDSLVGLLDGSETPYTIWKLSGTIKGLDRAFTALLDALTPRLNDGGDITTPFWQPSGDDDVFDYWPNTMDMLWDFACNLDTLTSGEVYRKRVWEMLDLMVAIGHWNDYLPGGESAFEWSADTRWSYAGRVDTQ
jgi:hypothetical protein